MRSDRQSGRWTDRYLYAGPVEPAVVAGGALEDGVAQQGAEGVQADGAGGGQADLQTTLPQGLLRAVLYTVRPGGGVTLSE